MRTGWDSSGPGEAHHYIEVGEYGLALEEIAGMLGLARAAITSQERDDMLTLGRRMTMDDSVSHALESCPCLS